MENASQHEGTDRETWTDQSKPQKKETVDPTLAYAFRRSLDRV
jgi:hypothetical protein